MYKLSLLVKWRIENLPQNLELEVPVVGEMFSSSIAIISFFMDINKNNSRFGIDFALECSCLQTSFIASDNDCVIKEN